MGVFQHLPMDCCRGAFAERAAIGERCGGVFSVGTQSLSRPTSRLRHEVCGFSAGDCPAVVGVGAKHSLADCLECDAHPAVHRGNGASGVPCAGWQGGRVAPAHRLIHDGGHIDAALFYESRHALAQRAAHLLCGGSGSLCHCANEAQCAARKDVDRRGGICLCHCHFGNSAHRCNLFRDGWSGAHICRLPAHVALRLHPDRHCADRFGNRHLFFQRIQHRSANANHSRVVQWRRHHGQGVCGTRCLHPNLRPIP